MNSPTRPLAHSPINADEAITTMTNEAITGRRRKRSSAPLSSSSATACAFSALFLLASSSSSSSVASPRTRSTTTVLALLPTPPTTARRRPAAAARVHTRQNRRPFHLQPPRTENNDAQPPPRRMKPPPPCWTSTALVAALASSASSSVVAAEKTPPSTTSSSPPSRDNTDGSTRQKMPQNDKEEVDDVGGDDVHKCYFWKEEVAVHTVRSSEQQRQQDEEENESEDDLRTRFASHLASLVSNNAARGGGGGASAADDELQRMERLWLSSSSLLSDDDDDQGGGGSIKEDGDDDAPMTTTTLRWTGPIVRPDAASYQIVVDAYVQNASKSRWDQGRKDKKRTNSKPAARQADAVLRRLELLWESALRKEVEDERHRKDDVVDRSLRPTVDLYRTVLKGYAAIGDGARCEAVLNRMERMHRLEESSPLSFQRDGNNSDADADAKGCVIENLRPNVESYNVAIDAWGNAWGWPSKDAGFGPADRVELLLHRMEGMQRSGQNPNAGPTVRTYTSAMRALARHRRCGDDDESSRGGERAERLLRKMKRRYEETGYEGTKPTAVAYEAACNAWAIGRDGGSGGTEAATRARALLDECEKLYVETGDEDYRPTAALCNAVLNAYARSDGGKRAADDAMRLLDDMEGGGGAKPRPDARSYTAAMNAIARSGETGSAHAAEGVLQRMDRPDAVAFTCAVHAYAKSFEDGCAIHADRLLMEWDERVHAKGSGGDTSGSAKLRPLDAITHAAVVHRYEKATSTEEREVAPDRTFDLLRRIVDMWNDSLRRRGTDIDPWVFNTVINLWSKSGRSEAGERADEVMRWMEDLRARNPRFPGPNLQSYTFLIDAWTNSGEQRAGMRALEILRQIEELGIQPDARAISSVIEALTKSKVEEIPLDLPQRMVQLNKAGDLSSVANVRTFTKAIKSMSGKDGGAKRAFELLQYLEELRDGGDSHLGPNTVHYNAVIDCFANSKEAASAQTAEALLNRMDFQCTAGNKDVEPDLITFSTVIKAWSNSKEEEAGDRVESLLHRMEDRGIEPTIRVYTGVINVIASSRESGAAEERALGLLRRAEEMYASGKEILKPDLFSYTTVCSAFLSKKNGAERAIALLNHVEELAKADGDIEPPDLIFYSAVIHAWAKSKQDGARQKAEDILDQMIELYRSGRESLKPNKKVFNTVIYGWASSVDPRKALKANNLLDRMRAMSDAGVDGMSPNTFSYNWVIFAAATSSGEEGRAKAFSIAQDSFNLLHDSQNLKPNSYTYSFFIRACDGLLPPGETREGKIVEAFNRCCQNGHLNDEVVADVRRALPDHLPKLGFLTCNVGDMPLKWSRNHKDQADDTKKT